MQKRPPRVTLVLAVCAALGAAGFSTGLSSLLAWNEPIPEMQSMELPPAPPGEEESWHRVEEVWARLPGIQTEVLREKRAALAALAAVNFVSSGVLFFGALAARMRWPRGLSLLRTGLVLSQAWAFLATLVQSWVQLAVLGAMRPVIEPLLAEGGTVGSVGALALLAQGVAVIITALFVLVQLVFYVWALRWTRRPEVSELLLPERV